MAARRWSSWAATAALLVLTGAAAGWSVSTSPGLSATLAPSPTTVPPGAGLTVTPKVVLVGQAVHLSGTGCPHDDEVLTGVTRPVTPNDEGSWSLEETVGLTAPAGRTDLGAYCFRRGGRALVFSYPTATVRVSRSAPEGARFTMSPARLMVGRAVRLSGTDCPRDDHVLTDYGGASPRPDGSWSMTAVVDQESLIGAVLVGAECVSGTAKDEVFAYRPIRTVVDTFRHLRVSPDPVPAGTTTLTVDSVGPCPAGSGSSGGATAGYWAQVDLTKYPGRIPLVSADSVQQYVSDREWSAVVSVPGGLGAGRYTITATCEIQRLFLGYYRPLTIAVVPTDEAAG